MRDENQLTAYENKLGTRLTNEQVIQEIGNRLKSGLGSLYPDINPAQVVVKGNSLGGRFAHTFRFIIEHPGEPITIFAKICPMYERLDPARKEFDTLKLLFAEMNSATSKYAVSRPLVYFDDLNCYAMESVGVNELRSFLLKHNSVFSSIDDVSRLEEYIVGSAEWLALFHKITVSKQVAKFDFHSFLNSFTEEFDYREIGQFSFSTSLVDDIDATFSGLSKLSRPVEVHLAGCHWDYTPGHVYMDNNKISVIDILGLDDTPIYEDIGHYLASITCINNLPNYPFFDRKRSATTFSIKFIDAYYNATNIDKNDYLLLTNLYWLKHLLIYFLIQNRQVSQKLGRVAGKVFSNLRGVRIFEQPIQQTLSEIKRIARL